MRSRQPYKCIGVEETEGLLQRNDLVLLDVRDAGSFAKMHIDRAQNVSVANLSSVIDRTATATPVLIYCYHGRSSREYAQILSDFGFSEVYSLDGGYEAWSNRPRAAETTTVDETLRQWLVEHGFPPDDAHATIGAQSSLNC